MATFHGLPFEIRDIIYRLVVVYEHPVAITSPYSRHKCPEAKCVCSPHWHDNCCPKRSRFKTELPKNFSNLSRVSKQVSAETSVVFYSLNTFLVSNKSSDYHSPHLTNLHALRYFTTRVPSQKIGLIRRIHCAMHIPATRSRAQTRTDWIAHKESLKGICTMARSLETHFRGVESMRLIILGDFYAGGDEHVLTSGDPRRKDAIPGIACAVEKILKLERLNEVRYHQSTLERLPELVEKALKSDQASERDVEVIRDGFKLPPI